MPWQLHHGGHVGNMMGCDHPSFIQIGPLIRELQRFQHFAIWRPSAILNKNLVMRDPTHEVNYMVRSHCQNLVSIRYSPPEILRFYNFAILAGKCLTTPSFGFFGISNPLILWVVIQTPPKGTSLGDDAFKP